MDHSSVSWEILFCTFLADTVHDLDKGAHQSAKFETFNCSRKVSPNLYFDRLLKVYQSLAKKYREFMSHDPKDWCIIWRTTNLLFQKWQEFGEI